MITSTQLYWLTRLDNINHILIALLIMSIVATIASATAICTSDKDENAREVARMFNPMFASMWLFALAVAFTPTTKEMAAILVIPQIANNEKIQEDEHGKLYDLAVEWMNELKPKHEANQ